MPPGSTKDPLLPVAPIVGSTVPAAVVPKLTAALPEPVFRSAILKALVGVLGTISSALEAEVVRSRA